MPQDENLGNIRKIGRKKWKQVCGYHCRSLAETALYRVKMLLADHLTTLLFETQTTQALIRCQVVNRMTHLGMPESFPVE